MTNLQDLGRQINALIARRDAGEDTQAQIDALMVQFDAHPDAVAIREAAEAETRRAYWSFANA